MPRTVTTAELRRMLATSRPQLVEVLPRREFDEEHLPGAVNIPLSSMDEGAVASLDRSRRVVTYCYDLQCDLSPRAAAVLESLGFEDVVDYAESKVAWLAAGLAVEGTKPSQRRAGAIATVAPTCGPAERVGDLRDRLASEGVVVVVDGAGVVLGLVRAKDAGEDADATAASRMRHGPPSVRPSIMADELAESMASDERDLVLVTTYDGRLLGLIRRDETAR
jgi:rhodanese-related sulfurtransferase